MSACASYPAANWSSMVSTRQPSGYRNEWKRSRRKSPRMQHAMCPYSKATRGNIDVEVKNDPHPAHRTDRLRGSRRTSELHESGGASRDRPADHEPDYPVVRDRESTRLDSRHAHISYAVFCV